MDNMPYFQNVSEWKRATKEPGIDPLFWILFITTILLIMAILFGQARADELWKITAYCACEKCCGKSDGIMASGKKVYPGAIALNWLPFGTKVKIQGLGTFTVEDRGAKSLFGTKTNPIKHIDIYFPVHKEALKFGVKWMEVEVLNEKMG